MAAIVDLQAFYKLFHQESVPNQHELGHFNLFRIEDMDWSRLKKSTYSRRSYFKVSLLTGHSKIHYADQSIEIADSALIFTNPMIPYYWERIGDSHRGYVCIFTESFFGRFGNVKDYPVFQSADKAIILLNADAILIFKVLFEKMDTELQGDYVYKYDFLRNLLMEVIHGAQKMQPALGRSNATSTASERIAGLFLDLLERQFPIELSNQTVTLKTPAAFAERLNIHINHLNKALKEITGKTTSQLISNRIYQEARLLLKTTNWSINDIAWCLGFDEPQHFSSFFKSFANVSPKGFRQLEVD